MRSQRFIERGAVTCLLLCLCLDLSSCALYRRLRPDKDHIEALEKLELIPDPSAKGVVIDLDFEAPPTPDDQIIIERLRELSPDDAAAMMEVLRLLEADAKYN